MAKYKLQKFGVNYLNVTLAFEGSTENEVQEMVHTIGFGTLRLVKGAKVLELDVVNPVAEGFTIVLQVEEYDGAMEGEVDVMGELDEATLFIENRFEVDPDYITLFVNKEECTKAIELEIDGFY